MTIIKLGEVVLAIFMFLGLFTETVLADLTIERKVKLSIFDTVSKKMLEAHKECLQMKGGNVRIENITFGEVLIIRTDKKLVWEIDKLRQTYVELSFKDIFDKRREILDNIKLAKNSVVGTEEEKDIDKILFDMGDVSPDIKINAEDTSLEDEVVGIKCKKKKIYVGNKILVDGYFTDVFEEGSAYFESLTQIGAFPVSMTNCFATKGLFLKGNLWYTLFDKRITATIETLSISKDIIKAEDFDIPNNFKREFFGDGFERISGQK